MIPGIIRKFFMKKAVAVAILTIVLIISVMLSASSVFAMKVQKAYPDYEIQVSAIVIHPINNSTSYTVTVKIKNMLTKKYINAWTTGDSLLDFNLTRTDGTIGSFRVTPNEPCATNCLGNSDVVKFYSEIYKVIASDVFRVAMKIQDAGFIPVIKYGKMDFIDVDGNLYIPKEIQPTGTWANGR
jgi:hypothetical protein